MTYSPTASDPIAALWQAARALLAETLRAFGAPAAVAHAVSAAFKRRLALLESLVMKLLLIEAASFHPVPGRGETASPGPMNTGARERSTDSAARCLHATVSMGPGLGAARQSGNRWTEDPADSRTWRVRFRPRLPRHAAANIGRPAPPRRPPRPAHIRALAHARRLARRFEALRRVVADPRRAAAALARKLHALGARAGAVALRMARAMPRRAGGLAHADALVRACDGWLARLEDSS
mgnify:CR=1 FL=1